MINAEAGIALPAARRIVPEGVELLVVGVEGAKCIGPAVMNDLAIGGARLGLEQSIVGGSPDRKDIAIFGHDVPVAGEHRRPLVREQLLGMAAEPVHPVELVVELLGPDGIAIGKIERRDDNVPDFRLDVAAMRVVWIAGKADAASCGVSPRARIATPLKPFWPCQTAP